MHQSWDVCVRFDDDDDDDGDDDDDDSACTNNDIPDSRSQMTTVF